MQEKIHAFVNLLTFVPSLQAKNEFTTRRAMGSNHHRCYTKHLSRMPQQTNICLLSPMKETCAEKISCASQSSFAPVPSSQREKKTFAKKNHARPNFPNAHPHCLLKQ